MKQHITVEQLEELSEKGMFAYAYYCKDKGLCILDPIKEMPNEDRTTTPMVEPARLPLLSIGQMIEFLVDHATEYSYPVALLEHDDGKMKPFYQPEWINGVLLDDSFVENLWEATKQVLEREW